MGRKRYDDHTQWLGLSFSLIKKEFQADREREEAEEAKDYINFFRSHNFSQNMSFYILLLRQ